MKALRWSLWTLAGMVLLAWFAWTTLTLCFANFGPPWLRELLSAVYLVWLGVALVFLRPL